MKASGRMWLAGIVVAASAAAVVGGFLIVGSPGEARLRRMDDRRVSDLRELHNAIDVYKTRIGTLPATLDALVETHVRQALPADPATGRSYEYASTGNSAFELCATFDRASSNGPVPAEDPFWSHGLGRQCFPLVARDLNRNRSR